MSKLLTVALKVIVFIALCTGMREGEISALTWNDIDFEKRSYNGK